MTDVVRKVKGEENRESSRDRHLQLQKDFLLKNNLSTLYSFHFFKNQIENYSDFLYVGFYCSVDANPNEIGTNKKNK